MKHKILLILFLLCLTTISKADTYRFSAVNTACTLDYSKTVWSDWNVSNILVTWNADTDILVIHSSTLQVIKYGKLSVVNTDDGMSLAGGAYDNGKYVLLTITYLKQDSYIYMTIEYNDIELMYKMKVI